MHSRPIPNALFIAIATLLSISAARAELITLPAVPITVADCRLGDHWGRVNGIARCVSDTPPPIALDNCTKHGLFDTNQGGGSTWIPGVGTCYNAPVAPAYSRIYAIAADLQEGMNHTSQSVQILRNAMDGSGWSRIYQAATNEWYGQAALLPWGYDLSPFLATGQTIRDPSTLRPPMQFFLDRGCQILSDNGGMANVIAPYGSGSGYDLTPLAGNSFGSSRRSYWNWAVCTNDVL